MGWIIVNKSDESLCWSCSDGWTDSTFDTFSDEDRNELDLPIDGEWRQVLWGVQDAR